VSTPAPDDRYAACLAELFARARHGVDLSLDRMRLMLAALAQPETAYPVLHIGGTNGKGSTAAFAEAMLRAGGLRTGLYTSPHLVRATERIRVGGQEIARDAFVRLLEQVFALPGGPALTFFELITLVALLYFREQAIDVAVLEVGLGGRLDATNVVAAPRATCVTGVALDHQAYLGGTLAEIAREKAGIWKPGVPAVVALPDDASAAAELLGRAAAARAPIAVLDRDFALADGVYRGPGGALTGVRPGLAGPHQQRNAALALALVGAGGFALPDRARVDGLAHVRWAGRLERFGDVLLDCAHNPDAVAALIAAGLPTRTYLVFGALADKDGGAMLSALAPRCAAIWLCAPSSPRATPPEALRSAAQACPGPVTVASSTAAALAQARAAAALDLATTGNHVDVDDAGVLVTGSIYLCGEIRRQLTREPIDPLAVSDPVSTPR
jgi:dihydrofolate synthase/folylpolyglutamate synthase